MSISLRLRPATLFVAGALLVPCAAFAQDGILPIVPTDSNLPPVPSAVTAPQSAQTDPKPVLDMSFRDVEITQLLEMISTQFDVPIAVSGEVSGKIGVINLKGKTAEQAIEVVTRVAKLSCQKSDGIYIISRPDPLAAPAQTIEAPAFVTATGLPPITSSAGFNSGNSVLGRFGGQLSDISVVPIDNETKLDPINNSGDGKMRQFQIRIRNVKPSWMAYWIDPGNSPEPVDSRQSREAEVGYSNRNLGVQMIGGGSGQFSANGVNGNTQGFDTQGLVPNSPFAGSPYINPNAQMRTLSDAQFQQGGRGGQQGGRGGQQGGRGGVFQLPEGVDRITAIDPQNVLLVSGTPEGVAKLQATINFLDRPLRQVEIEAQFLSISTSDATAYGFDFSTARGNFNASSTGTATGVASGGLQLGFIRGNFQAAIIAATTTGRGKILTAPRILAINNLTASLQQLTRTPITLTTTNTAVGNAVATQASQQIFYVTTTIGLEVTPTINNDDTVTVLMRPNLDTQGTPNALGASQITTQQLQTIANVRDGETIALGGLRSKNISINKTKVPIFGDIPFLGKLFRSRTNSEVENELIIFLTARIIRRAGDDDTVAPTDLQAGIGG